MNAHKTRRLLAAGVMLAWMAGMASAGHAAAPAAVNEQSAKASVGAASARPVVVLIGDAILEEYQNSDPADRTEIDRSEAAQRPTAPKPLDSGKRRS